MFLFQVSFNPVGGHSSIVAAHGGREEDLAEPNAVECSASASGDSAGSSLKVTRKKKTGGEALGIENPILKYAMDFAYNPEDSLDTVNRIGNLIGAIPNFFAAILAPFGLMNIDEETSENIFGTAAKISTITRGITGAIDNVEQGNPLPFIGSILEIPTALTSNGFFLWLRRGVPQSIRQIQSFLKNRIFNVVNIAGQTIKTTGSEWSKLQLGLKERLKVSFREIGLAYKEIFTNPFGKRADFTDQQNKDLLLSRGMLVSSTFQLAGPTMFFAPDKARSLTRNSGGIGVDGIYVGDKNANYKKAGGFWINSAIFDFAKRFVEAENWRACLHHLAVFLDPLAAIFESRGNFDREETPPQIAMTGGT